MQQPRSAFGSNLLGCEFRCRLSHLNKSFLSGPVEGILVNSAPDVMYKTPLYYVEEW